MCLARNGELEVLYVATCRQGATDQVFNSDSWGRIRMADAGWEGRRNLCLSVLRNDVPFLARSDQLAFKDECVDTTDGACTGTCAEGRFAIDPSPLQGRIRWQMRWVSNPHLCLTVVDETWVRMAECLSWDARSDSVQVFGFVG
mmetsp:Transcript_61000/g.170646  ORF Transcript_61000/g.170646 Transcript_61000/m.170646 type:complete len:144 (+) Transcript_61000:390-821(+)